MFEKTSTLTDRLPEMVVTADGCWKKTSSFGFSCRHWWIVLVINLLISANIRVSPIITIMTFRWQKLTNKPSTCCVVGVTLSEGASAMCWGATRRIRLEKCDRSSHNRPRQTVWLPTPRSYLAGDLDGGQHVAVCQSCRMQIRQLGTFALKLKKVNREWSC